MKTPFESPGGRRYAVASACVMLTVSLSSAGSFGANAVEQYSPPQLSQPVIHTAASELPDGTSLPSLVDYALAHNPRIAAAQQRHLGALQRVPQATALPDPRLIYRYFFEEVQTRVGPQEYAVGFTQVLPWFGKLKLQGVVASDSARAAAQRVATIRNSVIAEVASAWY